MSQDSLDRPQLHPVLEEPAVMPAPYLALRAGYSVRATTSFPITSSTAVVICLTSVLPCPPGLPALHFVILSLTSLSVVSSHSVTRSGISVCLVFPLLTHVPSSSLFTHLLQLTQHVPWDQPFQFSLNICPLNAASVSSSCVVPAPLIIPSALLSNLLWNLFQALHVTALLLQMIFTTSSPSACPPSSLARFWSGSFKCSSPQPVTCR